MSNIVDVLNNKHSAEILEFLSAHPSGRERIMKELDLTRKMYYTTIFDLKTAGIIYRTKQDHAYHLTTFGRILFRYYLKISEIEKKYKVFLTMLDESSVTSDPKHREEINQIIRNQVKEPELLDIMLDHEAEKM